MQRTRPPSSALAPRNARRLPRGKRRAGFTLIEMLIVLAIMGIIMGMSAPIVWKLWKKAPMVQAVRDIKEVLSRARAQAILQGGMTEVVFHPRERRLEVAGVVRPKPRRSEFEDLGVVETTPPPPPPNSGMSATFDATHLTLEMLDVNLTEYKDAELARARFFPNGTCDELTIILSSDQHEWYKISLEITTALASVGPIQEGTYY